MNTSFDTILPQLIQGCRRKDEDSQKHLYQYFFGFAMSICLRYAPSSEEAKEIMNDGFMKVFTKIDKYDPKKPFALWVRRIMINTAIDYYRRQPKNAHSVDIDEVRHISDNTNIIADINEKEILKLVQELPPAYRMVFNLYVMEGLKHEEIAKRLGIHIGTSKSNLAKARKHLQKKLQLLEKAG